MNLLVFRRNYFLLFLLIFGVEILIAIFVKDKIIRPFVGDILVVILLYCLLRAFVKIKIIPAAILVLLFAYTIEILQYFKIVEILNLEHSKFARTVIGTSFSWMDLLCYAVGILFVLIVEKRISGNLKS